MSIHIHQESRVGTYLQAPLSYWRSPYAVGKGRECLCLADRPSAGCLRAAVQCGCILWIVSCWLTEVRLVEKKRSQCFFTNLWPLFCAALPRAPLGAHRTRRPGTLPGRLSHASQASHTPGESGRLKAPA